MYAYTAVNKILLASVTARVVPSRMLSDHSLVVAQAVVSRRHQALRINRRRINSLNPEKFQAALFSFELYSNPADTVDSFADQLRRVITSTLDSFAPIRSLYRRPCLAAVRWLSQEAVAAKRERRRLERRWLRTRENSDRVNYRQACRIANQLICDSRRAFYAKKLDDCRNDSKQRWRIVNQLLHKSKTGRLTPVIATASLCQTFADYFVSKVNNLKTSIATTVINLDIVTPLWNPPNRGATLFTLPPVTAEEVYNLLCHHPSKCSSADYLPTTLLLACKPVFSDLIATLANLSFRQGIFPSSFKHAFVTPLLKSPTLTQDNPLTTGLFLISIPSPKS